MEMNHYNVGYLTNEVSNESLRSPLSILAKENMNKEWKKIKQFEKNTKGLRGGGETNAEIF